MRLPRTCQSNYGGDERMYVNQMVGGMRECMSLKVGDEWVSFYRIRNEGMTIKS